MASIRSIRKRGQARIKRRNACRWVFRNAVRRAMQPPDWRKMLEDFYAWQDAMFHDQDLSHREPLGPQPFTPKAQQWAGTA